MSKPSPAYHAALEASKQVHKGKQFTGKFLRPHAPFIKEIMTASAAKLSSITVAARASNMNG